MQLLIMAAGMGSRFGGLKQVEPMGPNNEFIIDYSIYDAKKAGFSKVVFIIKEENYQLFKETIGSRVDKQIEVEYVFQKMTNVPSFVNIPSDRTKPWGTAQAIYCAKDAITEDFVVINADDFYGRDSFEVAAKFLKEKKAHQYATVGYTVTNTMTENGSVKRGVLDFDQNSNLEQITESSIAYENDKIIATPLDETLKPFEVSKDTLVSMNMLVFDKSIFDYIEKKMVEFFRKNTDLSKCEFLIPDILNEANLEHYADVFVLRTKANWYGVTYKEDKENVKNALANLIKNGDYPENLWR